MKILKFEEFLNEAHLDPVNKLQVLVAFILNRRGKDLQDNFTTKTYSVLLDSIPKLSSKRDLKTEIIPTVAPVIGMTNSELLEFVRLCGLTPADLSAQRKDRVVKMHMPWVLGLSLSNPLAAVTYLRDYFKRDDSGKYTQMNNPKFTGISKSEKLTVDTLTAPFNTCLKLTTTSTRATTKTYSLYDFINDKTNKESSLLETIKKMKYSKKDTVNMIQVGLNNMNNISLSDYDTIVVPKSSSKILPIFVKELVEYIKDQRIKTGMPPKDVKVIEDAFEKIPGKDIEWDYEAIEAIKDDKTKTNVLKMIDRISKLSTGISLSKQVFVGYRKYLKAFMKLTPGGETASGKILIVDDFITGGTTIKEMRRLLGGKSFAITLFDVVGIDPNAEPDENDPTV
jgi:hypothetical protein